MNPHVVEMLKVLERRYSVDRDDMTLGDWICANTKLRGRPFTFSRYPFQEQIANDEHPNMDVMKISQIGLTEVQIRKALAWLRRINGLRLIYTMPNEKMYKRIYKGRVKPLVDENAIFNTEQDAGAIRSMDIMQFGRSFLYITDSTEGSATSIDADGLLNDEVDLMDQNMLGLFRSRLQGSDYRINQRFSTPTHEGFGISLGFDQSDQHYYMVRCDACRHWNDPLFTRDFVHIDGLPDDMEDLSEIDNELVPNLDLLNAYVHCERCHAPLDLGRTDNRQWVAKYPSRDHARGYRVRPFSTARLDISYIITQLIEYKKRDYIRGWHNTVIGDAFTEASARLSEEQVKACLIRPTPPEIPSDIPMSLGIDVGQACHLMLGSPVSEKKWVVWKLETVHVNNLLDRVAELKEQFNIVSGSIDRHPYTPTAEAVRDLTEGIVLPVEYRGSAEILEVKDPADEDHILWVKADRTKMIDRVANIIRRGDMAMYGWEEHNKKTIIEHFRDLVRDEEPEQPAVWKKLTGNDHYFHAAAFMVYGHTYREFRFRMLEEDTRSTVAVVTTSTDFNKSSGLTGFSSGIKPKWRRGKLTSRM